MTSPLPSSLFFFLVALLVGTSLYLCWELSRRRERGEPEAAVGHPGGRWGPHTAPIDWCERNYAVTDFVAEFWNTLTCLFYVLAALKSKLDTLSFKGCIPPTYNTFIVAHALTGICSAIFHATLWWWGQKADEVWECITLVMLLHMPAGSSSSVLVALHVLFAAAIPVLLPEVATELHVALLVAGLLRVYYRLAEQHPKHLQRLIGRAASFGLLGFACWLVDKLACSSLGTTAQLVQLHSWWHLFTAAAIYTAGCAALLVHSAEPAESHPKSS